MFPKVSLFTNKLIKQDISVSWIGFVLMVITIFSKFISLFTTTVITNKLGTESVDLQIFTTASIIPEFLSQVLLFGAISSAVIPVLYEVRSRKGDEAMYGAFTKGMQVFSLIFIFFSLFFIIFSRESIYLLDWITRSEYLKPSIIFSNPEYLAKIDLLLKLMMIPQLVLGVSGFLIAGLQSVNKFVIPHMTGFVYALSNLLGALILLPLFKNDPIQALVITAIVSSFMHVLIQVPVFKNSEIWNQFKQDFWKINIPKLKELGYDPVKKMILLGLPRMISLASDLFIQGYILTFILQFGLSAQRHMKLAFMLASIPLSVFAYSNSVVAFTKLAKEFANKDIDSAKLIFVKLVNNVLFITIPVVVLMMILHIPLVKLTFGLYPSASSRFTLFDTESVAIIILTLCVGLIPEILAIFYTRLFFAKQNTIIPLVVSIFSMTCALVLLSQVTAFTNAISNIPNICYYLGNIICDTNQKYKLEVASIGIIFSTINFITFVIYSILSEKFNFKFYDAENKVRLLNKLTTGIFMFAFSYFTYEFLQLFIDTTIVWGLLAICTITVLCGVIVYYKVAIRLKVEEVYYFKAKLAQILKL